MREFSDKPVTFALIMAQDGEVSQAKFKRELDQLSKMIFEIDLKIQSFRAQGNNTHIPALEAAKAEIEKQILQHQVQLEYKKAQNKNRNRRQ